jgi:hypothetical protein
MIKLTVEEGVYKRYNTLASVACLWLNKNFNIPHKLKLCIYPNFLFYKVFRKHRKSSGLYFSKFIVVRQQNYSKWKINGAKYRHNYDTFIYLIMHEFCHYEEERDHKTCRHREICSRGRKLVKAFKRDLLNDTII